MTRDGSVVVATVPAHNQAHDPQAYADTLALGLTDGDDVCGAVVDLRGNTGGDMGPMVAGLSPLLPDGVALRFVAGENSSPVVVEGNKCPGWRHARDHVRRETRRAGRRPHRRADRQLRGGDPGGVPRARRCADASAHPRRVTPRRT
ncbi:hypothetical protein QP028_00360 [Corynebacterium suedekumii]|nr:hypothetical protein QP028_00360 [Corynebacterium suedekumii]